MEGGWGVVAQEHLSQVIVVVVVVVVVMIIFTTPKPLPSLTRASLLASTLFFAPKMPWHACLAALMAATNYT